MTGNECSFTSHGYIERVQWTAAISLSGNRPLIRDYEGLERVGEPLVGIAQFHETRLKMCLPSTEKAIYSDDYWKLAMACRS
jgi:hypothetical protein